MGGTDDGGVVTDAAPPAPTNTLVFPGDAVLLCCSRPPIPPAGGAAADRWCGIARPGVDTSTVSLLVFNLTKALAGGRLTCTATDTTCLQLDADVGTDSSSGHRFYGQTLVYYDASGVYAWRPGWTAGRMLISVSSTQPAHCEGSPDDVTTAICIKRDALGTGLDAYAGSIATQAGGSLAAVEPLGAESSGIGFSPDSLSVLWSVKASAAGLGETLKTQIIGDDTSRRTVATNTRSWNLSPDGTRWLWLSAPVDDGTFKTGTLRSAPYPAGTPTVDLQGAALAFTPFGAKGTIAFSNPTKTGADMKAIADVDQPTTTTTVLQEKTAFGLLDVDATGTVLYYDDLVQPDKTQDAYLVNLRTVKADGTGRCAVSIAPSADPSSALTRSGKGVAWVELLYDATSGALTDINGKVTTLADCAPHPFSSPVASFSDVTTGLVVQDGYDANRLTADLSYLPLSAAGVPGTPVKIQSAADLPVQPLHPDPAKVLFTISGRESGNGIYVSPALAGADPTAAAPVAPSLGAVRRATGSGLRALVSPRGARGAATLSRPAAAFGPGPGLPAGAKWESAFSRFALPALLRRPAP